MTPSDARFDETTADPDPIRQFGAWFRDAEATSMREPNAMTLATASREGRPSARIVLLKGFDAQGFVFFTNYESRKGEELDQNPLAALVFHWRELTRQVRVEGRAARITAEESDAYFQSRPRGSQLGAWASAQSRAIEGRDALEQRFKELAAAHEGRAIPRPPFWGGFRLTPDAIEFWQGRLDRLHDRFRYVAAEDGLWIRNRLSP
jgi:pyridoxamine 5'-phosphate oxidase